MRAISWTDNPSDASPNFAADDPLPRLEAETEVDDSGGLDGPDNIGER
jgi:hypothetical protein